MLLFDYEDTEIITFANQNAFSTQESEIDSKLTSSIKKLCAKLSSATKSYVHLPNRVIANKIYSLTE